MEQKNTALTASTLSAALSGVVGTLVETPDQAEQQAQQILTAYPGQMNALMALASTRRAAGDATGARNILETLAKSQPGIAAVHCELGRILSAMEEHEDAAKAFARTVELEPRHPHAWRLLGNQWAKLGNTSAAANAYLTHFHLSAGELRQLENALLDGDERQLGIAGARLDNRLRSNPSDPYRRYIRAKVYLRQNRLHEAEILLTEAVQAAPEFAIARYELALTLHKETKVQESIQQLDLLLEDEPDNPACLNLKAVSLSHLGEYEETIRLYERLLQKEPAAAAAWVGYGHVLKTVGKIDPATAAFRKAIELQPGYGDAYWQLADLKISRFTSADVAAMRTALADPSLAGKDRTQLHFALGKALEDGKEYAQAFREYAKGNTLRRKTVTYNADETSSLVRRSKTLFTADFLRAREGLGCPTPDPVFIVGLARSGSTLIEQILASHPSVEGTKELPTISSLAMQLQARETSSQYPELLGRLSGPEFCRLGQEYIDQTRAHRKLGSPFFIDKMPANFLHLGLIHLILPRAKIIDARRHPLGCGFANFKQHFTHGQAYSYDLEEIGRYYRDYADLMAHFEGVLPGRMHRVVYEELVANPEREVRRLLDYCGLPFDNACLRFYENGRPVLTASAEQVRRPIFTEAIEQWRQFEPWLGPLKTALGDALYPSPAVSPSSTDDR